VPIHYKKKNDKKDEDKDAAKLSLATGAAATQLTKAICDYYNGLLRRGCDAAQRQGKAAVEAKATKREQDNARQFMQEKHDPKLHDEWRKDGFVFRVAVII